MPEKEQKALIEDQLAISSKGIRTRVFRPNLAGLKFWPHLPVR